jgi:hypothetical protein
MKYLIALFAFALTLNANAMTYDDGCGPDKQLCNGSCIDLDLPCAPRNFEEAGPSRSYPAQCYPACGPDEYCAVYFAGRSTCFPKH